VDPTTHDRALARGFDIPGVLAAFDAFTLFHAIGDAVVTGPTGNNLRDIRILLSR
jgi:hydroxypyruvate reductase